MIYSHSRKAACNVHENTLVMDMSKVQQCANKMSLAFLIILLKQELEH